ncbi:MAG TPA: four-helix bundle copper-binding protein [Opitutaceae bacterium]|nr:four-helix bundle copper-binding protein [Opitutaceae bacterium]
MRTIELMLQNHPNAETQRTEDYSSALEALSACEQVCSDCADACLGETAHLAILRRCIRINLDCAEVCATTARLLSRHTETASAIVHAQLHACVLACQICGDECEMHADIHNYCRICAETCRLCQKRCNYLLGMISASGVESDEEEDLTLP